MFRLPASSFGRMLTLINVVCLAVLALCVARDAVAGLWWAVGWEAVLVGLTVGVLCTLCREPGSVR